MDNAQIRQDMLETLSQMKRRGLIAEEWQGFLSDSRTNEALKELATSDQLFAEFFRSVWAMFGVTDVADAELISLMSLEPAVLAILKKGHESYPCGMVASLLLKFRQ